MIPESSQPVIRLDGQNDENAGQNPESSRQWHTNRSREIIKYRIVVILCVIILLVCVQTWGRILFYISAGILTSGLMSFWKFRRGSDLIFVFIFWPHSWWAWMEHLQEKRKDSLADELRSNLIKGLPRCGKILHCHYRDCGFIQFFTHDYAPPELSKVAWAFHAFPKQYKAANLGALGVPYPEELEFHNWLLSIDNSISTPVAIPEILGYYTKEIAVSLMEQGLATYHCKKCKKSFEKISKTYETLPYVTTTTYLCPNGHAFCEKSSILRCTLPPKPKDI